MIRSMTGFGTATAENDDYKVSVELKAVNQRFLELAFHMPHPLAPFEDSLRRLVRQTASRGKVDIFVTYLDKRERAASIRVDKQLADSYHAALDEVAAYPDVLQVEKDEELEGFEPLLLEAAGKALKGFDAMRQAEGANIAQDFYRRIESLEASVAKLKALAPAIVQAYRARIEKTLQELLAEQEIDETRIIQETALYADKVNYTEEVVRLGSHFQQFRAILESADSPIGRKLDFLIQEMNRETNTIASKANSAEAAQLVVDMKSEIEKLREQVQNIE